LCGSRSRRPSPPRRTYWLLPPGSCASAPHNCTCRTPRPRSGGGNAVAGLSTTSNQWDVTLTLKSAGTTAFTNLTAKLVARYLSGAGAGNQDDYWLDTIAVVLDGNIISAPHIESPIPDGIAQIAGNFTRAQAEELAAQLHNGALPIAFRISPISTSAPAASSQAAAGAPAGPAS